MQVYFFETWYPAVKSVLPEDKRNLFEQEFDQMAAAKIDSTSFVARVTKFIDKHIGKSASNPLSLKVYSCMTGYSEKEVKESFMERGLK